MKVVEEGEEEKRTHVDVDVDTGFHSNALLSSDQAEPPLTRGEVKLSMFAKGRHKARDWTGTIMSFTTMHLLTTSDRCIYGFLS